MKRKAIAMLMVASMTVALFAGVVANQMNRIVEKLN